MFQSLVKGNPFYIFRKGDRPTLQVGKVVNVTNQTIPYGSFISTVEVTVSSGEQNFSFKELLPNESIHEYIQDGVTVSENKDMIRNKIEGMFAESMGVVESYEWHKNNAECLRDILFVLNPQLAKEKAQEEKIERLEQKVVGVEGALGDIKDMLSKALNTGNNTKKQNV